MSHIIKNHKRIDTGLSSARYFEAVFRAAASDGMLTKDEAVSIQGQLWRLLGSQTERFTMGDSSSLRIELTKELLESMCYSIGTCLKQADNPMELLKSEPLESLFRSGQAVLEECITEGKLLLSELKESPVHVNNIAYRDTVTKALPAFFRKYDGRFFAHETPCDIDYPLCIAVPEIGGIEYINAYMLRLSLENAFCRCFEPALIRRLLHGYSDDSVQLLINIFEPVLFNTIGHALLGTNMHSLEITAANREALRALLEGQNRAMLQSRIAKAINDIFILLDINDKKMMAYIKKAQKSLIVRLEQGVFDALFISFKMADLKTHNVRYCDSAPMPDEALRELISEMAECRYTSDKLAMVKQYVHSLRDLMEVLNICFFENEYSLVFDLLSREELLALLGYLRARKGEKLYKKSQNNAWENALLDYFL